MTHEELRQGERIASVTTEYDWWVVTGEQLREEWAAEGLTARECAAGAFHAVTAAQPAGPPR
ncbi:hypothetical protein [Streptomyces sp. RFCAC02]|uniref:hypothetical protein n=1 Tax=Streptomyces sp. RFCAC02 TaxID=2499143 RepID=UPI0019D2B662|nr:hypothetical protein [Streptomyces sp. RFCAC02]